MKMGDDPAISIVQYAAMGFESFTSSSTPTMLLFRRGALTPFGRHLGEGEQAGKHQSTRHHFIIKFLAR